MNDLSTSRIKKAAAPQLQTANAESATPQTAPDDFPPPANVQQQYRWHWSLFIAAILLSILALNWILPKLSFVIDTFGNFQWQIVFLVTCLAVYQGVRRRWVWMFILLGLIAVPALNVLSLYIPVSQPPPGKTVIKLLSLNVYKYNTSYEPIGNLIRDTDPDILQLIEYSPECDTAIRAELERYPYQLERNGGLAIFSKIPMERDPQMQHAFDPWEFPGLGVRMEVAGQQVCLIAVHPLSPVTGWRQATRDTRIRSLTDACWYRKNYMHVVVAGDFNATTHCDSVTWFLKHSGLRDTRVGFGLQDSWPAGRWPFMVCIDHVFVSDFVHVHSRQTERRVGSDHLPVLVELSFGRHPRTRD